MHTSVVGGENRTYKTLLNNESRFGIVAEDSFYFPRPRLLKRNRPDFTS